MLTTKFARSADHEPDVQWATWTAVAGPNIVGDRVIVFEVTASDGECVRHVLEPHEARSIANTLHRLAAGCG